MGCFQLCRVTVGSLQLQAWSDRLLSYPGYWPGSGVTTACHTVDLRSDSPLELTLALLLSLKKSENTGTSHLVDVCREVYLGGHDPYLKVVSLTATCLRNPKSIHSCSQSTVPSAFLLINKICGRPWICMALLYWTQHTKPIWRCLYWRQLIPAGGFLAVSATEI